MKNGFGYFFISTCKVPQIDHIQDEKSAATGQMNVSFLPVILFCFHLNSIDCI